MESSEKILLYWSGEADEALSREIEALLDSDEQARAYLSELNAFEVAVCEPEVPAPRAGLMDEVLEEHAKRGRVIEFPKRALWAAAAIALMAVALSTLYRPGSETALPVVVQAPAEASVAQKPKLSERLLTRNTSFRDSNGRLKQSFRQRSRWQKL